jgi:hypothetical protein
MGLGTPGIIAGTAGMKEIRTNVVNWLIKVNPNGAGNIIETGIPR